MSYYNGGEKNTIFDTSINNTQTTPLSLISVSTKSVENTLESSIEVPVDITTDGQEAETDTNVCLVFIY